MDKFGRHLCRLVVLGVFAGAAWADQGPVSGRDVFERHRRACHGGPARADSPIGPSLVGIVGRKAGAGGSGVHSRAMLESGIAWDRERLRRFVSAPASEVSYTLMPPPGSLEPAEVESLLDYLQSLS